MIGKTTCDTPLPTLSRKRVLPNPAAGPEWPNSGVRSVRIYDTVHDTIIRTPGDLEAAAPARGHRCRATSDAGPRPLPRTPLWQLVQLES